MSKIVIINKEIKIIITILHNLLPRTSHWAKCVGSSIVFTNKFPLSIVHFFEIVTDFEIRDPCTLENYLTIRKKSGYRVVSKTLLPEHLCVMKIMYLLTSK